MNLTTNEVKLSTTDCSCVRLTMRQTESTSTLPYLEEFEAQSLGQQEKDFAIALDGEMRAVKKGFTWRRRPLPLSCGTLDWTRSSLLASASQTRVAPIQNRPPRVWDGTASSQYIAVGPRTSISVQFHNAYLSNYSCNQRRQLMPICCLPKTTLYTNDDL